MAKSQRNRRDPICYFICKDCGAIQEASTSDVKLVGHPVCPNKCGNEEMTEVTYREFRKAESFILWDKARKEIEAEFKAESG